MIHMASRTQAFPNVHMVAEATLDAETLCGYYKVEKDDLVEVGTDPTCPGCAYKRIRQLEAEHDEEFDFWFRSLMIAIGEPFGEIVKEFRADVNGIPLPDVTVGRLYEASLLLPLLYHDRDILTELALEQSLCPLHFRDYAICFDDEDPECEQIREIHPSHDT